MTQNQGIEEGLSAQFSNVERSGMMGRVVVEQEQFLEPEETVEVIDWGVLSDLKWLGNVSAREMVKDGKTT